MSAPFLNYKLVGAAGVAGASASAITLYKDLTDPKFLLALYYSARFHSDPQQAFLQTAALLIGVGGGLLLAYLGRPVTVPSAPPKPSG